MASSSFTLPCPVPCVLLSKDGLQRAVPPAAPLALSLGPYCSSPQAPETSSAGAGATEAAAYSATARHTPPEPPLPATLIPPSTDGLIRWFEEFCRRLSAGWYPVSLLEATWPWSRGLSLYPDQGPALRCSVTRGVQVRGGGHQALSWFENDPDQGALVRSPGIVRL